MDVRTREAAGAEAAATLADAGWDVAEVLLEDPPEGQWPVCDEETKGSLAARIGRLAVIVTVGSGVITDLGKWLALDAGVGFVSFATAASMNGYTSANVAPTVRGVKTLIRARPAEAVLAAPGVLAGAPYEMTAAGLGDALAKSVSSADWYLNHLLFGDYYCESSVALTAEVEPLYAEHPGELAARDDRAISALFQALLLTGVAMTLAETSAPASGGEHLISHSLDMMATLDGCSHDLHGRQVGVASVLSAELWRRVLEVESPQPVDPPAAVDGTFWGPLADVVAGHYAEKAARLIQAKEQIARGDTWDRLRRELSPVPSPPGQLRDCLAAAAAACRAGDIGCDRPRLVRAFLHAHEIRSRFTVLDLGYMLGVLPGAAAEIVEAWA